MSTPGRRRALHALADAKAANKRRVARGDKPVLEGKQVSLETFNRKTGADLTKAKAKTSKPKPAAARMSRRSR